MNAKRDCLKRIFTELLTAEDKLTKAKNTVTNLNTSDGNTSNSFFVNDNDVVDVSKKLAAITQLINNFKKIAFANEKHKKGQLSGRDLATRIDSINKSIVGINDENILQILSDINTNLIELLRYYMTALPLALVKPQNGQDTEDVYEDYDTDDDMTSQEKHDRLKVHTFDDTWYFTFLAKLFMIINNALGIKTSEEELLETLQEEASKAYWAPK